MDAIANKGRPSTLKGVKSYTKRCWNPNASRYLHGAESL